MTSCNYAAYIGEALDSIMAQSYTDWELIIVDDGSQDNSREIINKYVNRSPERIFLLTHPQTRNLGIKDSNELAFKNISGRYTAFLESDDAWFPECLQKKIDCLNQYPDTSLVFSDLELTGETDSRNFIDYLDYCNYAGKLINKNPSGIYDVVTTRNPVASFSNIVIRSELLGEFNINRDFQYWTDWQLVLRAAGFGKFRYIDEKLVRWRIHPDSANYSYQTGKKILDLQRMFIEEYYKKNNSEGISRPAFLRSLLHKMYYAAHSPAVVFRKIFSK